MFNNLPFILDWRIVILERCKWFFIQIVYGIVVVLQTLSLSMILFKQRTGALVRILWGGILFLSFSFVFINLCKIELLSINLIFSYLNNLMRFFILRNRYTLRDDERWMRSYRSSIFIVLIVILYTLSLFIIASFLFFL